MLRHSENPVQSSSVPETINESYPTGHPLHPEVVRQPFSAEEIAKAIAAIEREKALRLSAPNSEAQIYSVLEYLSSVKAHRRRPSLFIALAAGLSCIGIGGLFLARNIATVHESVTMAAEVENAAAVTPVQKVATANSISANEQRAVEAVLSARMAAIQERATRERTQSPQH